MELVAKSHQIISSVIIEVLEWVCQLNLDQLVFAVDTYKLCRLYFVVLVKDWNQIEYICFFIHEHSTLSLLENLFLSNLEEDNFLVENDFIDWIL